LCALPVRATASATQVSIIQDDKHLVYDSPTQATRTMQTLASLGVDWVKVQMIWGLVAPDPHAKRHPSFDASDPSSYPPGAWARYDLLAQLAHSFGLKLYLQFAPPVPRWAFDRRFPARLGRRLGHAPDPADLEQFVEAVGRRYSGLVDVWGIWNEPNYPAWLQPMQRRLASGIEEHTQPPIYRALLDAAWRGLEVTAHAGDTILIGETANPGDESPITFVRDLYCVGAGYRQLVGRTAAAVGCPTSPNRARFVAQNPGLFDASGWAHHPYGFDIAPNRPYPTRQWITLYNIGTLERVLNRTLSSFGRRPAGGMPVYVSEWGYRTNPPNPYVKTSLGEQQMWLDEGDYMLWRDPFVRSIANFLLFDGPPLTQYPRSSRKYFFNFQSGLKYTNGRSKPSFVSYRVPIWLPDPRHGARVTVWSQLRAANHTAVASAFVEFRSSRQAPWMTIGSVTTSSPEGFLITRVRIPATGWVRVGCTDARTGQLDYSRSVRIR